MFVQAFSHSATRGGVAYPPYPAGTTVLPDISPDRCPKGAGLRRPEPRQQLQGVVKDCKNHQHHDDREADAEPDLLGPDRQRPAADGLEPIEHKVTAIEKRDRKQV